MVNRPDHDAVDTSSNPSVAKLFSRSFSYSFSKKGSVFVSKQSSSSKKVKCTRAGHDKQNLFSKNTKTFANGIFFFQILHSIRISHSFPAFISF